MGLIFECTHCNRRIPTYAYDPDLGRNCEDCGEDMCELCCRDGLCESCREDREEIDKDER